MSAPRALITNDDGVTSPGIATLAAAAVAAGFDVVVAAPNWDSSGASASLTAVEHDGRLLLEDHVIEGLDVPTYGVEAAPAFIVRAAMSGAFGAAPDVVLSGVNRGANTGHVVLHSGTVGAALTAATYGRPALAASLAPSDDDRWWWDTAAVVLDEVLQWFRSGRDDAVVVYNVNIPAVPPTEVRGLVAGRLARFGAVRATVTEAGAGWVELDYQPAAGDLEPGTDAALLADGYTTITPLEPVGESSFDHLDGLGLSLLQTSRR